MKTARGKIAETTDGRDSPAYTVAEAAHYLRLPAATLRSWALGRQYPTSGAERGFVP